jgi:hypothetical protein
MMQDNMQKQQEALKDNENAGKWVNKNLYELSFSNKGGLVMPIIVEWTFKDGTKEVDRIPVTIWRLNEKKVTKLFAKDKEVASIQLDPMKETADIDESNGMWPLKEIPSMFQLYKGGGGMRGLGAPRRLNNRLLNPGGEFLYGNEALFSFILYTIFVEDKSWQGFHIQ